MKRVVSLLIISLMVLGILPPMAIATAGYTVSGTVLLTEPAPVEGLIVGLMLLDVQNDMMPVGSGFAVMLESGEDQGNFSIEGVPSGNFMLNYMLVPMNDGENVPPYEGPLLGQGFYQESGTVTDSMFLAAQITIDGNKIDVDFTIPRAHTVSGLLSLPPDADPAVQDIHFAILRYSLIGETEFYVERFPRMDRMESSSGLHAFVIQQGAKSGAYSFSSAPGTYRFAYDVGTMELPMTGFYSSQGTTTNPFQADVVNLDRDTEINMTILEDTGGGGGGQTPYGENAIWGDIVLQEATEVTISLRVEAELASGQQSQGSLPYADVTIPAGQDRGSFVISNLPEGEYVLQYKLGGSSDDFPLNGFYSTGARFVNNKHGATPVASALYNENVKLLQPDWNIHKVYPVRVAISNVPHSLPDGVSLGVTLAYSTNWQDSAASFAGGPEVTNGNVTYNFLVPEGDYFLYYRVTRLDTSPQRGYYFSGVEGTTTAYPSEAELVTVDTNGLTGKNLTLLGAHKIDDAVLRGDVNGDGIIDVRDAILIMRHIAGHSLTPAQEATADVNGDDQIDRNDAQLLLDFIVGKIAAFPTLTPEGE